MTSFVDGARCVHTTLDGCCGVHSSKILPGGASRALRLAIRLAVAARFGLSCVALMYLRPRDSDQ